MAKIIKANEKHWRLEGEIMSAINRYEMRGDEVVAILGGIIGVVIAKHKPQGTSIADATALAVKNIELGVSAILDARPDGVTVEFH